MGCNKYKNFEPTELFGYAKVNDPLGKNLPAPLAKVTIYLNTGSDTTNYLFQATTDSTGRFSFPSVTGKDIVIFSRLVKNGTEYFGKISVDSAKKTNAPLTLTLVPAYNNGFSLTFTNNGPMAHVSFRIYGSRLAAVSDSVKYATIKDKTDDFGTYIRYNLLAGNYYIVAADSIGSKKIKVLDSVQIANKKFIPKTVLFQ
jgi:hypothetical protein